MHNSQKHSVYITHNQSLSCGMHSGNMPKTNVATCDLTAVSFLLESLITYSRQIQGEGPGDLVHTTQSKPVLQYAILYHA